MALSKNKEDYLKALFHLTSTDDNGKAGTNQLASILGVSAASVNNMLKKLKAADLVNYEKYGKVELTSSGRSYAIQLVRKHRIWETFLHQTLGFTWDEVHEVAEQLEHIQSEKLIDRLDSFLNHPTEDPHGDRIPAADGTFKPFHRKKLSDIQPGTMCRISAVDDSSRDLLQYASSIGLSINKEFAVLERNDTDHSILLSVGDEKIWVTGKFAESVYVE